jgi:hypothetical protein
VDTPLVETSSSKQHFSWRFAIFGAVGALLVSLPEIVQGNEIGPFFEGAFALLVVSLILLITAITNVRKRSLSVLVMLAIYCSLIWAFHRLSTDMRTTGRWFLEARDYKAQVLGLPEPHLGELKHVEWEGWGFAGAGDTIVYLVFDPNDALLSAAKSHSSGKFPGLSCPVVRVRRLEKYWYTALFYTDTDWNHCS